MKFPVDEWTLDELERACKTSLSFPDGDRDNPQPSGGDFTLSRLLNFLSGYDPTLERPLQDDDGYEIEGWVEYAGPAFSQRDVILALIGEVRELRAKA